MSGFLVSHFKHGAQGPPAHIPSWQQPARTEKQMISLAGACEPWSPYPSLPLKLHLLYYTLLFCLGPFFLLYLSGPPRHLSSQTSLSFFVFNFLFCIGVQSIIIHAWRISWTQEPGGLQGHKESDVTEVTQHSP